MHVASSGSERLAVAASWATPSRHSVRGKPLKIIRAGPGRAACLSWTTHRGCHKSTCDTTRCHRSTRDTARCRTSTRDRAPAAGLSHWGVCIDRRPAHLRSVRSRTARALTARRVRGAGSSAGPLSSHAPPASRTPPISRRSRMAVRRSRPRAAAYSRGLIVPPRRSRATIHA